MTRKQIERIVGIWQSRLNLNQWRLKIDFDRTLEENVAEILIEDQYDSGTLRLSHLWPKWERRYANATIVHELLHIHERDLVETIKSVDVLLGKPAYTVFYERALHEREGLVDRLAEVLVDLGGAV